jgi:hypothetical protein
MTLLTPLGALAALAGLVPLAGALLGRGRADAVRRALRLPPPERRADVLRPSLAAAGVALLGLAVAQPALTRTSSPRVRADVQAVFVLDTSRSMAASSSPTAPTRLDRAVSAAVRLREAIPEVESGVLTLTDRVLPDLLPVPDRQGFAAVVERAVRIESPPPRSSHVRATRYGALADIASGNVFAPTASRRLVVLLTDGESNPVQAGALARALPSSRGYRFAAIRFWRASESVYGLDGATEPAYRPDPGGRDVLRSLAAALGGRSFEETRAGATASYLRTLAGDGPTTHAARAERSRVPLAPYVALFGLLVLLVALAPSPAPARGIRLPGQ